MNKITTTSAATLMALTLFGMAQPIVSHADQINNTPATHQNNIQNKADSDVVDIPDANLKDAVKSALGVTEDKAITVGDMATLTTLDISKNTITSLKGLESATALKNLNLSDTDLSKVELAPISGMSLTTLNVTNCNLSDSNWTTISDAITAKKMKIGTLNAQGNHLFKLKTAQGAFSTKADITNQTYAESNLNEDVSEPGNIKFSYDLSDVGFLGYQGNFIISNTTAKLDSKTHKITWSNLSDVVDQDLTFTLTGNTGAKGFYSVNVTLHVHNPNKQSPASSDMTVSYDYTAPTPADPGWYSVVPADVAFTDANKDVDTSVSLVNADDQKTPYSGEKQVDVTVKSDNAYKLKDATNDSVDYKLDKDGKNTTFFTADDKDQALGTLDKTTNKLASKAHLTGTATKTGTYIDTLHYVFKEK